MVSRAVPLVIDILMTALAGIRFHEKLAGNLFSAIDLCGAGKKWPAGAVAFAVHGDGRQGRIFNAPTLRPASFSKVASHGSQHRQHNDYGGNANSSMTAEPSAIAQTGRSHQAGAEKAQSDVEIDVASLRAERSGVNQRQSWDRAEEQQNHSVADYRLPLTPPAHQPEQQPNRSHNPGNGVQHDHPSIKNIRLRERVQVNRGHGKEADQYRQYPAHRISGGRHDRSIRPPQEPATLQFATCYRIVGNGVSNTKKLEAKATTADEMQGAKQK